MLKITVQNGGKDITVRLEGKVSGPWADELENTWHGLETSLGRKQLWVDLREVRYIDQAGRKVLTEMGKSHAEFLADSPLTRYFAEEAMRAAQVTK